jgi:hypothetical protein
MEVLNQLGSLGSRVNDNLNTLRSQAITQAEAKIAVHEMKISKDCLHVCKKKVQVIKPFLDNSTESTEVTYAIEQD